MSEVLVVGGAGFLGQCLCNAFKDWRPSDVDIADSDAVSNELDRLRPDVLVNCAGKTGRPNIDWCETHKPETLRSNVTGPFVLLHHCLAKGIYFVHLSSGCLYTGDNGGDGFAEDQAPNFFGSFYVRTKIHSEELLKDFPVLILRPRMPFDGTLNPRNLIMKLRRYESLLDEQNSLTYLPDFRDATHKLVERRATGVFNVVNPGTASPHEIMEAYRRLVDPEHFFSRLDTGDLKSVASAGRSNCKLANNKLIECGIKMRPVNEAIEESLREISELRRNTNSAPVF